MAISCKHLFFSRLCASTIALAPALLPEVPGIATAGETISWPGNGQLQTVATPWSQINQYQDSLFPSGPSDNTLVVNGDAGGIVMGGYVLDGVGSANNSVTIRGGEIGFVIGGLVHNDNLANGASATGNIVTVSGGVVTSLDIYGGDNQWTHGIWGVGGGGVWGGGGSATGNRVIINGNTQVNLGVYGGYVDRGGGSALNNSVVISGGAAIGYSVYGGYVRLGGGSAIDNSVTIGGDTLIGGEVYGGHVSQNGGSVTGNSVTISGNAWVTRGVYGGSVYDDGGWVTGNSVLINGHAYVGENVYGGMVFDGGGSATGNSITLSGAPTFGASSGLWGGAVDIGKSASDLFSGNSLSLANPISHTFAAVGNFEYYRFLLPNTPAAQTPAMLQTTDIWFSQNGGSLAGQGSSSVQYFDIVGGGYVPKPGDRYTLISSVNAPTGVFIPSVVTAVKGVSLLYDMNVAQSGNDVIATVADVQVNPQTESLSEGRIPELGLINQGGDLAVQAACHPGGGMGSEKARNRGGDMGSGQGRYAGCEATPGLGLFVAVSGGSNRYNSAGHVDVNGGNLIAGVGWNTPVSLGNLLLAGFFEAGWGNYDSHNSYATLATIHGTGRTEYAGGGLLARYDRMGPYVEASVRAGHASTDFRSNELVEFYGPVLARYDSGSAYVGAHGGLGYVWNITERVALDMSTKLLWTRLYGDTATVAGDPITFQDTDSLRWRTGGRFNYRFGDDCRLSTYAGAYYEHEFDGKVKATVYGFNVPETGISGGTGVGELGVSFRPAEDSRFTVDLGVQGYVGKREGVRGNLGLTYVF
jgi:hypothetical protein